MPSPDQTALGLCLEVWEDGTIHALNMDGRSLIRRLRLVSNDQTGFRKRRIADLRDAIESGNRDALLRICGFPEELTDLRTRRCPNNSRPAGAQDCFYALRQRQTLPEFY